MTRDKCRNCGEASIAVDEGQGHVVCTACGSLQEDGTSFELDRSLECFGQACHSHGAYNTTFAAGNHRLRDGSSNRNPTLNGWAKYVRQICEGMNIRDHEMHKEAVDVFTRAFDMKRFKKFKSQEKRALCASSVFVTCRRHDWPILINDLIGVTNVDNEVLLKQINKDLIWVLKLETTSPSLEEYVPTCLAGFGVTDASLVAKTISIVSLAVDLWLEVGRRKPALIVAACCIAWQAATPGSKLPIIDFLHGVLKKPIKQFMVYSRYRELERVLKAMLSKVPWVSASLISKKNSVMFFLDDILKYKRTLIKTVESPTGGGEDGATESAASSSGTFSDPPAFKRKRARRTDDQEEEEERECKISRSGHLTRDSLDCPELSEKDIPDLELGLYIRTPEEIKNIREMLLLVDDS